MILFYGYKDPEYGFLSNWYECQFKDDEGILYNCVEQYMMAQKALLFNDKNIYNKIMETKSPKEHKSLGRQVKNFDSSVWDSNNVWIVYEGCLLKFTQNNDLSKKLVNTNPHVLAEASPYDKIWGIGLSKTNPLSQDENEWLGLNLLGKALMEVRKTLL